MDSERLIIFVRGLIGGATDYDRIMGRYARWVKLESYLIRRVNRGVFS